MRRLAITGLLITLFLAAACQEPASPKPAPAQALYFDVPGFIRQQALVLEKENPGARKSVVEKSQVQESKTLQQLAWQKELAAFADLDLNKPAYRHTFEQSSQRDAAGLLTRTYRKKPGTEGDISWLTVTTGPGGQVRALRALRTSENPLISTSQQLELRCSPQSGRYRISFLKISGWQKPIFFDTLPYLIVTEIH
ncbi:MAG: hypothetical protein ACO1O1_15205 [Adhaeribacter sp.]